MTTTPSPSPARRRLGRDHLAIARALLVAGLSLLVIGGFLLDVAGGQRPTTSSSRAAGLAS